MEVDDAESVCSNVSDGGKFCHLKAFVAAAREFESTHSENAVNLMTRYLNLIASSCDLSIFSPGRSEVCAFFSSLWRVMCDGRGPHWAGVAVLARAAIEPSARHALTHTYKFMPILTRLLSDTMSNDKKIKLLSVMQEITYGVKISWQESYLSGLMKQLTDWITQPLSDAQHRIISQRSLTVLVNVCYGNLPAIYALMRTVDTKDFVVHLINLKDGGFGGVEVCRLLLCLSGATRGGTTTRQVDVHSYLSCTMRIYKRAVIDKDATQLLHAYTFINDLCSDSNLRGYVMTYPNFGQALSEALKDTVQLCSTAPDDSGEPETLVACLRNVFKFLTVLTNLELYPLRCHHCDLVDLCMKGSGVCLPESLELFAGIISQYRDEGRLPTELVTAMNEGLPGVLVPPSLEPGKAGLPWLQVVGALCDLLETQERVLIEVTPDSFEETLYSILQYTAQNGSVGVETAQQCVVTGCRTALTLAPHSRDWDASLHRLLAHHQVRKLLCAGLTSSNVARRRQILQLIKHHYFPPDQMNLVFGDNLPNISDNNMESSTSSSVNISGAGADTEAGWSLSHSLTIVQEDAIDQLIQRLNHALATNQIQDIATSSVMELYGYKMTCLEQRLHSHSVALQGSSEHMAALQHSLALLQATNSTQQDVLYTTQMQNEKYKKTIDDMSKQLDDAENTVRGLRAKLAAERIDKEKQIESIQKELRSHIVSLESEFKVREKAMDEKLKNIEIEYRTVQKKLEQQTHKNNELAGVLVKFEEKLKQRDKRLEEASALEHTLKKDTELKETTIKQLEKTVLERENRLYQVTTQLEEMKRVQEMIAKLMNKTPANNKTNS